MHILDVISSVSRSSKCTKIIGGCGFTPMEELAALPHIPELGLTGPTLRPLLLRGKDGKKRRGEGAPMSYAPDVRNSDTPPLIVLNYRHSNNVLH